MRVRLIQIWERLSASYWFIPALMAVTAGVLAEAAVGLHGSGRMEWMQEWGWLNTNQPEGARSLLSTVAGSMITVAGVTFSMTLLAISHASAQMGPRLLTDFMRDRGNQITLGTFISTFIYCLLVLRSVRSSGPDVEAAAAFVPQEAVWLALILAIGSVGVLIYFVHHIPEMLSLSNLVERVSTTFQDRIDCLYPSELGEPAESTESVMRPFEPGLSAQVSRSVEAGAGLGYLQYIDEQAVLEWARERDVVAELCFRPGDFVHPQTLLAHIHGDWEPDAAALAELRASFVCGPERTPRQDVRFPALEISEIAIRALSPGVNDPFTAVRCIDHLEAGLLRFSHRSLPDPRRLDEAGTLRVLARPISFEELVDEILDALRPYACGDAVAAVHLVGSLDRLAAALGEGAYRRHILMHRSVLLDAALAQLDDARALEWLRKAAEGSPGQLDDQREVV